MKNNIFSSDSICVKFITSTLVIYGKGNQLQLRSERKEIVNKIRPYDKIHRISFLKCNDGTTAVACAAGKEILITKIINNEFQGGFITKFNDWISSIKILKNGSIAAVTSHNFAILLEHPVNSKDENLIIKVKLRCADNSTLYCSHIHGDVWDDLTYFAGTALGELIIWKNIENTPTTLYQKSLHSGVIFSIDYNHNFLATSSDDRSIKTYNTDKNWKLTELKQFFGHTARVFACKIIKYAENNFLFLSAGEDSNLCIWRSCDGKLLAKMNVDASGGIWSVDYDEKNAIVLTSSSKGKLNRFRLRQILFENVNEDFTASLRDKIEPAKIKFLSNGILVVLDYKMNIFSHNTITNEWKNAAQLDAERQKVIAIETWENRLFFMTRNSILIFDYDTASESLQFTSELVIDHEKFSLQFDYFRAVHALNFHQVFISDASGSCIVVDLTHQKLMKSFKIPKSAEPWSTSVSLIDQYWLIADRMGSLFLYRDNFNGAIYQHPIQKLSKLHAQKMGVKTIRSLGSGFIKTTGNDGTMKTLFLNKEKGMLEIYQTQKSAVKWIERVESFNGKEFILGFNDNYFVISKSSGEIIYEHSCGGRHRHWDIHFSSIKHKDNDYKMRLAYIKRKQVNCVEFFLNDFTFPSPDADDDEDFTWHTRVCNVIEMIDDDVKILASGGEDTIIKLFKVEMMNDDASLKKIAEINSHISSVKAMTMWKCKKSGDVIVISAGGRAQIVVTRIIAMTHVKEEVNFMLTNSLTLGNAKQSTFDPETRFTSLHFDHASEFLFVGCSDGYLRAFKLIKNDSSTSLRLMIESHYGKCILQVYALRKSFVLTMDTRGVVCFWHFDEEAQSIKVIDKLYHNQNGINSFDVYNDDDNLVKNCYKLATAGDDSGIFITEFEIVANDIKFNKKIMHSYAAHTAQVNGIKFLSRNELITTSIDQTLCKLHLIDDDKIEVVDKRFTCVADVKGFAFYDSNKYIFIYGAGLEMIKRF